MHPLLQSCSFVSVGGFALQNARLHEARDEPFSDRLCEVVVTVFAHRHEVVFFAREPRTFLFVPEEVVAALRPTQPVTDDAQFVRSWILQCSYAGLL